MGSERVGAVGVECDAFRSENAKEERWRDRQCDQVKYCLPKFLCLVSCQVKSLIVCGFIWLCCFACERELD